MGGIEGSEPYRLRRAPHQDLGHHLAVGRAQDHAIAFARRRVRRDDENIPVAVERLHTVARHFERVGILVVDAWKADLVPALTQGEAAIVEETTGASLREPNERDRLSPFASAARFGRDQ